MIPPHKWTEYKHDILKFVQDLVYLPTKEGVIKVDLTKKWKYQGEVIKEACKRTPQGHNRYNTIAICIPKQNGKTFMASLILLWKFMTQFSLQGVVASNSKDQASSVVFDTFKNMLRFSPELVGLVKEENILDKEVRYPAFNSIATVLSSSKAAAWGYGIDIGIVDEIHAAPDDEGLYQILQSQTGPRDGQIILPSQVSGQLNVLYKLYQLHLSGEDKQLFFHYVNGYNPSPLVTDRWLSSRKAQLTPYQYSLYHDNDWLSSTSKLFTAEAVGDAVTAGEHYTIPMSRQDLLDLESEMSTKFIIGAGLDRALPYSQHGDRTFLTTTAKGMSRGEEFYFILNQENIQDSSDRLIKDAIMRDNDAYRLNKMLLEVYQAADIYQWCLDNGIDATMTHAHDKDQIPSFNNLYQIFQQRRIALPQGLPYEHMEYSLKKKKGKKRKARSDVPILVRELKEFEHEVRNGVPKFGHKPGAAYHDDSVYSLNLSIYSTHEEPVYDDLPKPAVQHYENVSNYTGM